MPKIYAIVEKEHIRFIISLLIVHVFSFSFYILKANGASAVTNGDNEEAGGTNKRDRSVPDEMTLLSDDDDDEPIPIPAKKKAKIAIIDDDSDDD